MSNFAIDVLLYLIDLGLFWGLIISAIAGFMGRTSFKFAIFFLILFIIVTAIMVYREMRDAPDIEELLGNQKDNQRANEPKSYPELHPERLYEPEEDEEPK